MALEFPVSPDDITVEILNKILGEGWHNLFTAGEPAGGTGVLFAMLSAMNTIALVALGVVVVGVTVTSLMETAHEGKPFGERWHTMWVPLRILAAAAMLLPIPGANLSVLQGTMLSVTYTGIGLANYMWNISVDQMVQNAGRVTVRAERLPLPQLMEGMLISMTAQEFAVTQLDFKRPVRPLVCQIEERRGTDAEIEAGRSAHTTSSDVFWSPGGADDPIELKGAQGEIVCQFPAYPPSEAEAQGILEKVKRLGRKLLELFGWEYNNFGMVRIMCPEGKDTSLCYEKMLAIEQMAIDTHPLARQIAQDAMGDAADEPQNEEDRVSPYLIFSAERAYHNKVDDALERFLMEENNSYGDNLRKFGETAKNYGWGLAGAWYWTIARFNDKIRSLGRPLPRWDESDLSRLTEDSEEFVLVREKATKAIKPLVAALLLGAGYKGDPDEDVDGQRTKYDVDSLGSIAESGADSASGPIVAIEYVDILTSNDDIMIGLQGTGSAILKAANTVMLIQALASGTLSAMKETPTPAKIPGAFGLGVLNAFAPYIAAGLLTAFAAGMTLMIYLPAVPFIMWTIGVIGWVILVLESMAAAPLWAVGHALPEGEGFAGQWGRQGYILLLGVLLRPPLMMMAFWIAFLVMQSLAVFLQIGMHIAFKGLTSGYNTGFWTMIGLIAVTTGLMVSVVHRVYGIIPTFPQNVMEWLAMHGKPLGEEAGEGKTQQMFAGAAAITGAGKGGGKPKPLRKENKKDGNSDDAGDNDKGGNGGSSAEPEGGTSAVSDDQLRS